MSSDPPAATLRLMTWNIHRGFGPDRTYNLERIIGVVRRHRPDIVALQEVDSRPRWGHAAIYAELTAALGPFAAQATAIRAETGEYGHVLLSRSPLEDIKLHDLSVTRREPRWAIEARVGGTPLRVIAVHLGLFPAERRHQAGLLAGLARAAPGPLIMAGDFNEWSGRGPVTASLTRELPGRTDHRTFPARLPLAGLDRIYCRPAAALIRSWTDPAARIASDHLPLVAEIASAPSG